MGTVAEVVVWPAVCWVVTLVEAAEMVGMAGCLVATGAWVEGVVMWVATVETVAVMVATVVHTMASRHSKIGDKRARADESALGC